MKSYESEARERYGNTADYSICTDETLQGSARCTLPTNASRRK